MGWSASVVQRQTMNKPRKFVYGDTGPHDHGHWTTDSRGTEHLPDQRPVWSYRRGAWETFHLDIYHPGTGQYLFHMTFKAKRAVHLRTKGGEVVKGGMKKGKGKKGK